MLTRRFSLLRSGLIGAASLALLLTACSDDETGTTPPGGETKEPLAGAQAVADTYAKNVHANYAEALEKAKLLRTAIDKFVAIPSEENQNAAKQAWIASRTPYSPSEVYRFYGGPIDNETDGPEGAINAWPLDENFIDYTKDEENAGIINNVELIPEITKEAIRGENEKGGEANISSGYHAIEFLLWGQDLEEPSAKTAGKRPYTDYLTTNGTAKNQARRGMYLKLTADLLVEDLETLVAAWEPGKENYGKTFAADPKGAVTKMLTGMGSMANAELSGERMTVAFKNRSQEDEHSCFSDTTNADIAGNAKGIENVYFGKYGTNDGPGIEDLVKAVDPDLDAEMKKNLADAAAASAAMQSAPFDFAIMSADGSPERENIRKMIEALKKEARTIEKIGQVLGVTFELEKPSEEL